MDYYPPKYKFKIGNGVLIIYKIYNFSESFNKKLTWKDKYKLYKPYFEKYYIWFCTNFDFILRFYKYEIQYWSGMDLNSENKCLYCYYDPADCAKDYRRADEKDKVNYCYHSYYSK